MRTFLLTLACLALAVHAEDKERGRQGDKEKESSAASVSPSPTLPLSHSSFEIRDGDRVLFLGDTLLEREGTYGYLETRMAEQFADRKFTVRNLAFSADTPLGWSRASFDPAAKGFERLKEQLALVQPTVVFLGYGMAASLQEMTDRAQDWTLNRDPARYGAEPMSAARFKKELAQCMDAIISTTEDTESTEGKKDAPPSPASPSVSSVPSVVKKSPVRFVLLSPIRHEDLRAMRPGLPDPTEHNKLLEQYSKAIEELAKERGARFVSLLGINQFSINSFPDLDRMDTDNGIHLTEGGYRRASMLVFKELGFDAIKEPAGSIELEKALREGAREAARLNALRAAIIRKNELFFHRWRPANETYLFGFRKREQGKNGAEIPMFDPLIEKAEAEIERLKNPQGSPKQSGLEGVPPDSEIVLPTAKKVEDTAAQKKITVTLTITQNQEREIYDVDGVVFADPAEIPNRIKQAGKTRCLLRVSKEVKYAVVKAALVRVKESGFENVIFSAIETEAPATADSSRQTPAEKPDLSKIPANTAFTPPDFTLADGLEISLWAENPLLAKPTEMNWDAQGRLWVASSAMYPMIAPGQVASDKIIILEDPGHTGKATKSTVFVDGLLIPTGVAPVLVTRNAERGTRKENKPAEGAASDSALRVPSSTFGCYVGQSTELLYFEDTDGDGKADKKRIVFSGFGTEDTHHIVHTLRWGPDGRLYFSQSVYIHTHLETPWGVVRVNSGGVFAYDPRTERVEVVGKGLWNTWGHAWDKWGQSFYTDGAGSSGISWGFPGATFAPNEGARRTMPSISPGSYPKFAGLELIYSPHFPADWQGSAVTCDFRAHKIVHFKITDLGGGEQSGRQGDKESGRKEPALSPSPTRPLAPSAPQSGYTTEQLPVLVQTSDATFRPIDVKLGPDGALYIADWSNPIINHGEVDFRDPRRDHEHGRIWRVSVKGGAAVKWSDINKLPAKELIRQIESGSLWAVTQARHTLQGRFEANPWGEVHDALMDWRDANLDKAGDRADSRTTLESFWIKNRLVKSNTTLRDLFTAPVPSLRAIAARVIEDVDVMQEDTRNTFRRGGGFQNNSKTEKEFEKALEAKLPDVKPSLAGDPYARVRVEAMRALARNPSIEHASLILDAAVNAPKDDPFYEFAAWLSINDLAPQVAEWVEKNSADTAASGAARDGERRASGRAGFQPAVPGILPGTPGVERSPQQDTPPANNPGGAQSRDGRTTTSNAPGRIPGTAGNIPALPGDARPANTASENATRDAKILLALESLPADTTGPLLSKILAKRPLTRDGAGPWIELIGKGGGQGEVQGLFERVAKGGFEQPALVRAMNALADATRLRNLRPDGTLTRIAELIGDTHADTRSAAARLAGLWKLPEAASRLEVLATHPAADARAAAFEGLRTLGGAPATAALEKLLHADNPSVPPAALAALAQLKPAAAVAQISAILGAMKSEPELQATWRGIFQSKGATDLLEKNFPANLPKPAITTALRAARELGRKGDRLVAKLTPLAGESLASVVRADFAELAARAKKDGDPVAGEAMYRRAASACVTCHAIGGAGGKLGPDMTSIGASAPLDYIVESILDPAAKVKEGYHAFTFAMKDGTEAIGIPSRETAQEQFIRTLAGEQGLPKANIVSKKLAEGGASLMPPGLTAAWTDRERLNLYAFLGELGRPGPFDASKNNVARVWLLTDAEKTDGALKPEPSSAVLPLLPAYTLVDGRLTKDLLAEKIAMLQPKHATVHLAARFQATTSGKAKLNLTGIRKAWLDGQPLAIASEPSPSVDLTAGVHTFTVEVEAKTPPEVLRLESPAVTFIGD